MLRGMEARQGRVAVDESRDAWTMCEQCNKPMSPLKLIHCLTSPHQKLWAQPRTSLRGLTGHNTDDVRDPEMLQLGHCEHTHTHTLCLCLQFPNTALRHDMS